MAMHAFKLSSYPFAVLDKAAIQGEDETGKPDPWMVCSVQQVEEVKCVLRVVPIWAACIIYFTAHSQQTTFVVLQALQSDRHLVSGHGFLIPAGSFVVFAMLALTLWIPIYDRLLVPFLRRHVTGKEGGVSLLQRIGSGILLSILAMVAAALVEERRRRVALRRPTLDVAPSGGAVSAMSSLWLAPQLAITGLSEAFVLVGQVEFYYTQFPEDMRSVAGSFLFCGMAIANYLSGLLISVVHRVTGKDGSCWLAGDLNRGRLDYFYFLIAAVEVLNFGYFLICSRWYRYKGEGGRHGKGAGAVAVAATAYIAMGDVAADGGKIIE